MTKLGLGLFLALLAAPAGAQTLIVSRGSYSQTVTAAQVRALPRVSTHVIWHDQPHDFEGVALSGLLERLGVDLGHPLEGGDLAAAVRVTGADGYQIVLAMSELDPATRRTAVILADRESGQPLASDQGPWRLVASDDIRPARSARQVMRIEVLDLATSSKAPAP